MEEKVQTKIVHFKHLDSVRAIGCLYISFAHAFIYISTHKIFKLPVAEDGFVIQIGHMFISTFFVLSGFLISYFLIKEKEKTNTINIKQFYIRRAFRILPVYFVGLIIVGGIYKVLCILFAKNNITEPGIISFCENVDAGLLLYIFMMPNVAFAFDKVLFHLSNYWSIGVEEQFYIIWPIILFFSTNILRSLKRIFIVYTVILIITFAISVSQESTHFLSKIFKLVYLTRFAAFAFGGFCAYAIIHIDKFEKTKLYRFVLSKYTQFFSFVLLFVFSFIKNEYVFAFKHVLVLIPANAIIIFNMALNRNNLFNIENKFLNYIGMTTYSMYAFNLIFLEMFVGMGHDMFHTSNPIFISVFAVTMLTLISIASYKFIEVKFLNIRKKYFG